jgi:hypothetical protein
VVDRVAPTATPLTFEPPPNGVVVAAGATLNTRLEPINAQTPPRGEGNKDPHLRIDSPRDGAVVAPGETLHVTVSSPDRTRFDGIVVVMEDPIEGDYGAIPASLPARFAIKIPEHISSGLSVSAMAGQAGGELFVAAIEVDIERREMPRAITPRLPQVYFEERLPQVYFEEKGETREIELVGDFGNGDFVDVTKSSRVTRRTTARVTASARRTLTKTASSSRRVCAAGSEVPRVLLQGSLPLSG